MSRRIVPFEKKKKKKKKKFKKKKKNFWVDINI